MTAIVEARRLTGMEIGKTIEVRCSDDCQDDGCIADIGVIRSIEHTPDGTVVRIQEEGMLYLETSLVLDPEDKVLVTGQESPQ